LRATQGFPAAEPADGVEDVGEAVVGVVVVTAELCEPVLFELLPHAAAAAITAMATTAIRAFVPR
jgi:hypothetical protein